MEACFSESSRVTERIEHGAKPTAHDGSSFMIDTMGADHVNSGGSDPSDFERKKQQALPRFTQARLVLTKILHSWQVTGSASDVSCRDSKKSLNSQGLTRIHLLCWLISIHQIVYKRPLLSLGDLQAPAEIGFNPRIKIPVECRLRV